MTFLNGLLAFGALAFTIPLAIHLLFRSRFRTVQWGAMHLLDRVVRINRRRIELMNLLLLLLRCLLPILLAICLARPVMTGFQSLPGDQPRSIVIVVDDSLSMSARGSDGVPRIDLAKNQITQWLGTLSRRDEVMIVRASSLDAPSGVMGAGDAVRKLRGINASAGPVELASLVRAGVDAIKEATHPLREVIVVSDFQSNLVTDSTIETLGRIKAGINESAIPATLSFLNFGVGSDQLSNVSVESVQANSPAVVAGRTARYVARIRNAGDTPVRDLRLVWTVDGQPRPPQTIAIDPRSSVGVGLTHTISAAGVHVISASVEHGDAILQDNQRSLGVDVIDQIDVVLVDGRPSNRPLEGETDYLAVALSPFAFGGQDQPDAVRTEVISSSAIVKTLQKQTYEIVVLANVAKLNQDVRAELARFVHDGGALVIFDGDRIRPDEYNQAWTFDDVSWDLPAKLGSWVGQTSAKNDTAQPMSIGSLNRQYDAWGLLGASERNDDAAPFRDVEVFGYRKFELRQPDAPESSEQSQAPASTQLLGMESGDPLAVTSRRGKGKVVQFAIACDADASTLPLRTVFLPMMQQLVLDLAGSRQRTTLEVGSGISVSIAEFDRDRSDEAAAERTGAGEPAAFSEAKTTYSVTRPDQSDAILEPTDLAMSDTGSAGVDGPVGPGAAAHLFLPTTTQAGVYRFRQTRTLPDQAPVIHSTARVAVVPPVESRLRDVEPDRLESAAQALGATVYFELDSMSEDDRTRRFGREIWRTILWVLLIAMIGELLLQQLGLGKRSGPVNVQPIKTAGVTP